MPDKILVVDDNLITRNLLQVALAAEGFEVNAIGLAAEVDEALRARPPDLVLLDLVLPDATGFDVLAKIRTTHTADQLPVLAVTGLADEERMLGAGFTDHLLKPVELTGLADRVRLHLRAVRTSSRGTEPPSAGPRERITPLDSQADREAQVTHATRIWKAMRIVLERICDLPDTPQDVVQVLDEILGGLLDASGFSLGLAYTQEGDRFELRSQLGFSLGSHPDLAEFFGNPDLLQRALDGQNPIAFDRASVSRTTRNLLARARVGSMLLAPLIRRGRRIGVIVLASLNPAVPRDWLDLARAASAPTQAIALADRMPRAADSNSEHRFRQITESLPDGVVVADATRTIVYANPAAERILGCAAAQLVGQPISAYLSGDASATPAPQLELSRPAGKLVIEVLTRPVVSDATLTLYTLRDLTARTQLPTFTRLATHDPLTGLFNRQRFDEAFAPRLAEARRYGRGGALLLLDLDRWNSINDRFGHRAGDAVLHRVGQILMATTRDSDTRAWLGGGEFAILLPHASSEGGERCARKILAQLASAPVELAGTTISIEASIGIAVFPDHGTSRQAIVAAADSALYRAKRSGHPRVCAHKVDDVVVRIGDDAETLVPAAAGDPDAGTSQDGLPGSRLRAP